MIYREMGKHLMDSRRFRRKIGFLKEKKLFVIATEGGKTEEIYFDLFKPGRDAVIRMEILPCKNCRTSPKNTLKRLLKFKNENMIKGDDELWLVIDRDNWEIEELDQVASQCSKKRFFLAVSNPCFEFWLYLHLRDPKPFHSAQLLIAVIKSRTLSHLPLSMEIP